ncbi:rCG31050 [Rattus norvegicus]|uniref:Tektin-2 n=2 Tax=Rattus norvegicus TaxID=10116 RepID=TEKT2_RAT|nr:tektin-2 [Rattus norvegicus]XP_006238922.1 tektin-2 isoform X1 [Rattus norvegicus]XP_006238923.1 tektin-2 isoform X1 [Rattus norvegicus]Q6AYM2.1 RecName: Full=Tektin-2; AltName: Full=Tektin-t; AltName: Full=Testicular tektin [Rattus norvegicus]AAH78990.1 Tektin 2 (testicular) [Rattus norvegicus]EDL80456.1 rCG31050 [Rattus norvegicus]|eukprot:NP_001011977.1 tektin-2 [Rattus norvegicus]
MATLSLKPSQRYRLSDWLTNSYLLSTNAERQRDASHQIRQEARILRNETNNQTVWDEHDNRTRLAERIDTVNRWKEMLDKCLTDLDAEIDSLTQAKESVEQSLQAKNLPLDVAIECLTLRESRRDIDVVKDPVEEELMKEVEVIEATKKVLQEKISQAFQHLCLLQEIRQQLNSDHRDKMETLEIDRGCLSLNLTAPNLSLKVNPTRVPKDSTTLQEWDDFTRFNKNRADTEMKASIELRETIALAIAQTNNELEAQRVATEFTFRKRLREMESLYSELKWQEKNTLEEIAELQADIRRLEEDLRRKMMNLKLAHTRLESRTYRPNVELCRDQTQYGLIDEVHQLEATISIMKQKLAQTQDALDALFKHLARIQADIACKTNTMLLDTKCMDIRRKLTVPAEKFVPQVDTFTRTTNRTLSPLKTCQLELN